MHCLISLQLEMQAKINQRDNEAGKEKLRLQSLREGLRQKGTRKAINAQLRNLFSCGYGDIGRSADFIVHSLITTELYFSCAEFFFHDLVRRFIAPFY
jgi:hypothetical protein